MQVETVEITKTHQIKVERETVRIKCCEGVTMVLGIPTRASISFYRDGTFVLTIPTLEYMRLTITRAHAVEVMRCIKPVTAVKINRMEAAVYSNGNGMEFQPPCRTSDKRGGSGDTS